MKIAIIGGGYVGLHTALRLVEVKETWEVVIIDTDQDKIDRFMNGVSPIDDYYMDKFMKKHPYKLERIKYEQPDGEWSKYDSVFISLSTNPATEDSSRLNTDLIFKMAKEVKASKPDSIVTIRSTINIDDSIKLDEFKINYWPEFLSQGVETSKNINQPVNVISIAGSDDAEHFFSEIFENKTLIKTKSRESILVKVMHNTLDAYLINITNLFANISQENEMNFDIIAPAVESLLARRNKVKRSGIGYGGSCYPKDSYSLINITKKEQNRKLIQSMEDFNNEQSYAFMNFEEDIRNSSKIIVLGSSFKGGTNDITRTPTKSLRNWMIENNISYKIWEPMINEKWLLQNEEMSTSIVEDIKDADLIIVASDWNEFNELLLSYDGKVIDLKSFIKPNGKMKIKYIGNV